ncbi:MAG: hypothetical protein QOG03_2472, partial [Actinomycetota bacterium]|nr:hypothetical protein [Actinomycetota bacterium]
HIQGVLYVETPGGTTEVPIENAGGSTKRIVAEDTSRSTENTSDRVDVRLIDKGTKVVARADPHVLPSVDATLVGLLPGALGGQPPPGVRPLAIDAGTARFAAIDAAVLSAGAPALAPLGAIGATADDLTRLAPAQRVALETWVAQGGHLMVDAAIGATITGLPAEWQPGSDGRVAAGSGEVRATNGAISRGEWSGLVEPVPLAIQDENNGQPDALVSTLARTAGVHATKLAWLVFFLFVYVLAVGPALFIGLHRSRRTELAWIVVPLVALLFTAAGYAAGQSSRRGVVPSQGTVVETGAGSYATTFVGVLSRKGGDVPIQLGDQWVANAPTGDDQGSAASFATASGLRLQRRFAPNEFDVIGASGPVNASGRLTVTAARASGPAGVSGSVHNGLPYALHDVIVVTGTDAGTTVGSLAAGETKSWSAAMAQSAPGLPVEAQLWGLNPSQVFGYDPSTDQAFPYSAWTRAQAGSRQVPGADDRHAVAIGWTEQYQPKVRVGSEHSLHGSTAFVGRAPITGPVGNVIPYTLSVVQGDVVSQAFNSNRLRSNGGSVVVRLALPDADDGGRPLDASRLHISFPSNGEVWVNGAWQLVGPANASGPGSAGSPLQQRPGVIRVTPGGSSSSGVVAIGPSTPTIREPLPVGAITGGVVWIRMTPSGDFGLGTFKIEEVAP